MIDIYTIIAVGIALAIGFIPMLSKKFRGENFLVSHYLDKSSMTQAEMDECKRLGYTAFMKKVEEESTWRKKHKIPYEEWRK